MTVSGAFLNFSPFGMMSRWLLIKRVGPGGPKNLWIPLPEKREHLANVLMTEDGQILTTVNKSYRDKNGQWGRTNFLNPSQGDMRKLVDVVQEFHKFEKMGNGGAQE